MISASDVLSPAEFVERVLELRPRVAAFDCDGTLWDLDSGKGFYYYLMDSGLMPAERAARARARYAAYERGEIDEQTICEEMTTNQHGISAQQLDAAARQYFSAAVVPVIFDEMFSLTHRLAHAGCELWAVSSTTEWLVKVGAAHFGISPARVLAGAAEVENGVATDRLLRLPSGPLKAKFLGESLAGRELCCCFGNSRWDADMMALARHAFAVNPNPDLEQTARARGWHIYWPERTR